MFVKVMQNIQVNAKISYYEKTVTGNNTKNMKIFITGGFGYIGSAFAKEAVHKSYSVILYDSLIYEQDYKKIFKEIIGNKSHGGSANFVIGDTRNTDLLEKSLRNFRPDYILHLAELSSVYACDHNPPFTEEINFLASKKVVDLAEKLAIPILYNSTSSLYGNQKIMKLMKENDILPEPTDNYCKFKLKMEQYIREKLEKNMDFRIIVFRPATVCGLSPRMRIELLPNHFTYCAVANGVIRISELNAFRAAIDMQDLIGGYFAVIKKGAWKNTVYNIGHHNLSKQEFAAGIQSVVKSRVVPIPDVGDLRNLQIDCSLFEKEFNYKPKVSYKETVKQVAAWVKKNQKEIERTKFAGILNMSIERFMKTI